MILTISIWLPRLGEFMVTKIPFVQKNHETDIFRMAALKCCVEEERIIHVAEHHGRHR